MDRQAYLDKKNKSHGSESQEIWGQGEKLASQALTQRQALRSNEEAFLASQNERRRKRGLNLNVNNGRIYTFSPLSKSELENSLSWADSEISKLKASGGADGVAGSILKSLGKVSGPLYEKLQKNDNINSIEAFLLAADDFGQKSEKISELEAYKNTVQQYMDNIQFQEDIDKIKSDKFAENKFGAIFNIDNDKKLYFLNAGEEGYDNDFYYERSSRRDKLINELQEMGYDDIERYIKNYSDYRSDKTITPILEYISKSIVEHPVIGGTAATASNILISPMRGAGQAFDSIAEALGIHGYKAASLPAAASQVTTETVHNVINETFDNKHAAGFVRTLYNAAVSGSESMLAMGTFGKLGEAVLGLGAAADTYSQARERGLSDGQALMNGIAAGIFETLFEHLSLEKLRAFKVAPAASVKDFIKTVVFQAGFEGSEEILTDLANEAYDYMVNGGLSQYEQALNSGMTAGEYGKQFFLQLIETLATGALSGAGMAGAVTAPSVIRNVIGTVAGDIARGEEIRKTGDTYTVLDKAKEQGGKVSKAADKISKKLYDNKGVSDRTLGRIERKTSEAAYKETKKEREADIDKILDNELSSLSRKEKNAVRSSVLTLLKNPLSVVYEQQEVLESENGKKALELMAKYYDIRKEAKAKNKKMASEEKNEATAKDISEHMRNDTTDELVKNTFSGKHKDGYEVGIGAVKSIKEGDFEVVQDRETGATALLSDVKIENEEADILYKTLRERVGAANRIPMTLEAVNVALSLYEPNINRDARMYALWAHDASIAATVGLSYKAFVSSFDGRYKNYITDFQLEQVYKAAAGNLVTKSGVTRIGGRHLSKMETEALFLIDRTFRKYGIHCVAIDGLTDENGHAVNALLTKKDVIVLNLNADGGLLSVAAGHELFHWLKKNDKNSAEYLQNLVIAMLKADKNVDFDALYKQRANVYTDLNENELLEEIAAQYFGVVFSSESNIRKVVNEATDVEKGILRKIVGRLKSFIKNLKAALKEYGIIDKTVRAAVESDIGELEEMARLFDVALSEAAKNKKPATDEGGVKYSRQFNNAEINSEIINLIERVREKKFLPNEIANIGTVDDKISAEIMKLTGLDVSGYSVVIEARQIEHILKDHGENGKTDQSLSNVTDIAKMGFVLNNPDFISNAGRTQAYSYMEKGHNRTAKTVLYEKRIGEKSYYVVQAVPITKAKKLFVVSAFIGEQGYKKEVPQLINAKSPDATTEYGSAIHSNNTVPQKVQTVNNNDMQKDKKDNTKYSRALSSETKEKVLNAYDIVNLNDSIEVQRKVFSALQKNGFFTDEARTRRIDVNEETGMEIETNKSGINETFSYKNFVVNSNETKIIKLATITSLPSIIQKGKIIENDVPHAKNTNSSATYAYLLGSVYIDNILIDVKVTVRKSPRKNKFWVHHIYIKNDTAVASGEYENRESPALQTNGVNESVSQPPVEVKDKYSRQFVNDTWEGIRDMMYENDVHQEVITEIEGYIKKLRRRNLSRETALTEGLIPKYDAILKMSREYTKGSKVSAHELADTINELMWAAHDGDLDTKQFVSTVKIIAEEILRTGSKVNDDMYREYESFRKMTREETVHVNQMVYDQYVEEYGSVKNLNRAISGKIKIRPYDEGNRKGRALDDFYGELQELFPGLFRDEVDIYHQLYEILRAWEEIQPTTEYFSDMLGIKTEADLQHQALVVAEDILSDVLGIKETVKTLADKYADKAAFQKEYYKEHYRTIAEEGRQKRKETEEKNILLNRITRNTKRLSDMLINQTDKRHIPENLKGPVSRFLQLISLYTDKRTSINSTLDIVQLGRAYAEYGVDNTANYDEDVQGWLEDLAIVFKDDVKISELNVADLKKVDTIVQHFNHLVNHGNEMFINGKRTEFLDVANKSFAELYKHAMLPEGALREFVNDKEYFMQTPIYFFKNIATRYENGRIVNDKLFDMFNDIRKGQDKWFRNIESVKKQIEEIKLKNNYSDSWKRDLREFELMSGERIKLTSEEVMYMYALNKREANNPKGLNHLLEGGIIADESGRTLRLVDKLKKEKEIKAARNELKEKKGNFTEDDIINSLKKNIVQGDLINMFATLTEDMQGYADDLVDMMSTTGAGMGNEVSMDLFGIKKFTEKYYIPISVAKEYLHFSVDNSTAEIRLKNRSFTKNTVRNANATVYVKSITDIAADHMQQMSLYNAMTVPIENIMRVYNYQKAMDEEISPEGIFIKQTGKSYKDVFKAVYGERGDKYFTDFMRDLNGGNQTQARDFVSGMIGMFKRSAVTGSLSVAIQQPSAVVRACALVDAKYFVPGRNTREDYEEMMKYNPVAGIKEIGRFDTGIGQTATEWILDENNGFIDKADNILMYLPGRMDRMTWTYIWKAVKRETKALNKELSGDKLLEKAAERFRDVIDYTQVYDSTIARSGYMRDQGGTAKMVTAFMAEPTLSYNLLRDAAKNFGNDWRQGLKSIAAFTGSTILNALLKSMVTALRKDDDESNYFELYTTDVIGNFFDDMNPLSLLPVVKDILNLAMGYDVERPDMTLFSNLINSGNVMWKRLQEGMTKEDIPVLLEELSVFIGAVSAFTKIPLNNLIKDLRGTFKTILGIKKSPDFSLNEVFNELKPAEDHVRCYDAIINKDDKFIERYLTPSDESINGFIKKGYSEEDAILKATDNAENNFHSKVVLGLISEDIRIREAADARLEADAAEYESILEELCEQGFDRNDVITAVNKYIASLDEPSYKKSEDSTVYQYTYDDLFNAIDKGNEASENAIYEYLRSNGAGQSSVQNKLKERYAEDVYNAVISKNEASYERYRKMFEEKYLYSIDKVLTYALEEYDGDIREAAESRYNLDFEEYQRIADSIIEKGFENTVVYGAIESAMNEFKPETPDKTYVAEPDYNYETEYADMHRAFEQNDLPKMKYVISELLESGVKASSIKKSLSGKYRDKYKEAWKNADIVTIERIRSILYSADVGYSESDFRKWEKAANDTQ